MKKTLLKRTKPPESSGESHHSTDLKGAKIPEAYLRHSGVRTTAFNPPPAQALRLFFAGVPGEGKTTFACSVPNAVICDFEDKATGILRTAPGTIIVGGREGKKPPWALEQFDEFFTLLISEGLAGRRHFDMVVIDTLGGLCRSVTQFFSASYQDKIRPGMDFGSYGKDGAGYGAMNNWIVTRLCQLQNAGYGWLVLAHKEIKVVEEANATYRIVKLVGNPGVVQHLHTAAEYQGTIARRSEVEQIEVPRTIRGKTVTRKETEVRYVHVLDIETQPAQPPRNPRAPQRQHVPMGDDSILELPEGYGWDAFLEAYNSAVARRRAEVQGAS